MRAMQLVELLGETEERLLQAVEHLRLGQSYGPGGWRKWTARATVLIPEQGVAIGQLTWYTRADLRERFEERWHWSELPTSSSAAVWLLCLQSGDCPAALEPRKVYRGHLDPRLPLEMGYWVVDEFGERQIYPRSWFTVLTLSAPAEEFLEVVAGASSGERGFS